MLVKMNLRNSAIALTAATLSTLASAEASRAIVTATNNPDARLVEAGAYSGVARLSLTNVSGNTTSCTGSLLRDGLHLLTAAHCITDGQGDRDIVSATASFTELTNSFSVATNGFFILPGWQGDLLSGNDLAILKLTRRVVGVDRYGIYRDTDEVGQIFTKVGYGRIGTGNLGERADLFGRGKLFGQNRFDARAEDFPNLIPNSTPGSQLLFDFDNGRPANNFFADSDLGLGSREVNTAPGDSGSPAFIGKLIAGITTYGERGTGSTDLDDTVNSSFGEYSSETRVSSYRGYIARVLDGTINPSYIPASVLASAATGRDASGTSPVALADSLDTNRETDESSASATVPEPSSLMSLLAATVWGAVCVWKRKPKAGKQLSS
ncbi:trypsin-like serine protease [Cyanobacteria bacterium FACHB-471]|nr:trypsin-like serine protease [Cyanobacteria bacterium FACHB-471]